MKAREAIAEHFGMPRRSTLAALSRAVYKDTECGAYVARRGRYTVLGTIVEGSDATFEARWRDGATVTPGEVSDTVDWIEEEADRAWRIANE